MQGYSNKHIISTSNFIEWKNSLQVKGEIIEKNAKAGESTRVVQRELVQDKSYCLLLVKVSMFTMKR